MVKASEPIRLKSELVKAAREAGLAQHRSVSEQIEYWAEIGRRVSNICIGEKNSDVVIPDTVFDALERDRNSGALSEMIAAGTIRYQLSIQCPGLLEQVHTDGGCVVGQFSEGKFKAI